MPPLLFQPLFHLEFSQRPWERGKDYISPQVTGTQRRQVTLPQKELGFGSRPPGSWPGTASSAPSSAGGEVRAGGQEAAAEVMGNSMWPSRLESLKTPGVHWGGGERESRRENNE